MIFLFWIAVIWLAYVFVGYPLLLSLLGILRRVRPAIKEDYLPAVSVLIAARDEEKDIGWKINETLRWNYPKDRLELLVASDASQDRTDEIVRAVKDARLTFLRMEERAGKNRALNRLAQLARGDLLFFTDANAHIAPDCLRRIAPYFADDRVGCVTGDSCSNQTGDGSTVENGARVYLRYESLIKRLEARIGSVLVCDGAIFCIRSSLFQPLLPELANDLELPARIGHAGYWTFHEPRALVVERDTRSPWESFNQRRRISAQGMLALWKLRKEFGVLRGWQFVSRKFLRWLMLLPLALLLISTYRMAGQSPFTTILAIQIVFYALAFAGLAMAIRRKAFGPLLSVPCYVVLGAASTLTGVADAFLGCRFDVWEIPVLSRGGDHTNSQHQADGAFVEAPESRSL